MGERRFALCDARMVKSADTADLKSAGSNPMGVRVPLRAPSYNYAMWFNLLILNEYLDAISAGLRRNHFSLGTNSGTVRILFIFNAERLIRSCGGHGPTRNLYRLRSITECAADYCANSAIRHRRTCDPEWKSTRNSTPAEVYAHCSASDSAKNLIESIGNHLSSLSVMQQLGSLVPRRMHR